MPGHLLGGQVRLSTVLITLVFIVTLATYLLVRPVPASGTDPPAPPSPTSQPSKLPAQTPTPASPTPTTTPRPSHTPTASPSQSDVQLSTSPPATR
jgi:hypothetical protein